MKTQKLVKILGCVLLLLSIAAAVPAAQAQGKVKQRSLQEWLDAQGTLLPAGSEPFVSEPQTPYLLGWGNNPDINGDGVADGPGYYLWYDYAGVLSRSTSTGGGNLGPQSITGTVTERPLRGGLAEVTVSLAIKGAVIWVVNRDSDPSAADWATLPLVFGHREEQLASDPSLEPALADVQFTVTILNEVGAPLPDLFDSYFKGRFLSFHIVIDATGPLSAAFGVAEGTPGELHWGKPGTLTVPANPKASNGAASGFPDDQFHLFPVGKN